MNGPVLNIEIEDAENYVCFVERYRRGLLQLSISARHPETEHTFYIYFAGVMYYEGPLSWVGVGFRVATDDECAEVLLRIGLLNPELEHEHPGALKYILEHLKLFKTETSRGIVKIVSPNMSLTDSEPKLDYSW